MDATEKNTQNPDFDSNLTGIFEAQNLLDSLVFGGVSHRDHRENEFFELFLKGLSVLCGRATPLNPEEPSSQNQNLCAAKCRETA